MGKLEVYLPVGREKLRCGYTTGTCAAAAAAGAARRLLLGEALPAVRVDTPAGITVEAELLNHAAGTGWASCAVRKDGGDDPDVTDGALICARVERRDTPGIAIDGGVGVGRVTRPGLDQPVGEAAINSTPRRMIREQAERVMAEAGYTGGLTVTISVPEGERLAGHTFNPRLGIEGGISILGTSGIVRPMSEAALIDSLYLEQLPGNGHRPRRRAGIFLPAAGGTPGQADQGGGGQHEHPLQGGRRAAGDPHRPRGSGGGLAGTASGPV